MSNGTLDHLTALLEEDRAQVWILEDAVELCRYIEAIAPEFGCHVALTGGCLYKDGRRKDADILFYRIRQAKVIDQNGLLQALTVIGLTIKKKHGWVIKAEYHDKPIDLFFPEDITETPDGTCLNGQYPDGPICPKCRKHRKKENNEWIHDTGACNARYTALIAINALAANPINGNRVCNICQQDLVYHPHDDSWQHGPVEFKLVEYCSDPGCSNPLPYGAKGLCHTCRTKFNPVRDMNPNFIGLDALRRSGATLVGTTEPTPPPTNQKPIIQPAPVDISIKKGVDSQSH